MKRQYRCKCGFEGSVSHDCKLSTDNDIAFSVGGKATYGPDIWIGKWYNPLTWFGKKYWAKQITEFNPECVAMISVSKSVENHDDIIAEALKAIAAEYCVPVDMLTGKSLNDASPEDIAAWKAHHRRIK